MCVYACMHSRVYEYMRICAFVCGHVRDCVCLCVFLLLCVFVRVCVCVTLVCRSSHGHYEGEIERGLDQLSHPMPFTVA